MVKQMVKKKNIILIISIVSISIVMMIGGAFSSSFQDPQ